jgi:hypothetical protein
LGPNGAGKSTLLQILAPHANSGEYTVQNPVGNYVEVIGSISEPLNTTEFSFILSNIVLSDSNFDVYQDNLYFVTDLTLDFLYYPIKTIFDVENGQAVASWKIQIVSTGFIYEITNIINNKIYLLNDGSLTNTYYENLDYKLLDNSNNIIFESTDGIYNVVYRGRVVVDSGTGVGNIQTFLTRNNYFFFDADSSQYYIDGYPDTLNEIYIDNYNAGDQGGVSGKVLQRLAADNGNLDYNKMLFLKPITFPTFTDPNDPNALEDSTFKENYLIEINSSFYSIVSEETIGLNQYLFLSGKFDEWGTISSGGTSVSYDLIRYVKDPATIMLQDFDFVDRSGQEVITNEIMNLPAFAMTDLASGSETKDFSVQEESIGYTILTKDNKKTEGNI